MTKRSHPLARVRFVSGALALGALLVSCGSFEGDPDDENEIDAQTQALIIPNTVTKWPAGVINVCWLPVPADLVPFKVQVRNKANDYWPTFSRVLFSGWNDCVGTPANTVRLKLDRTTNGNSGLGQGAYEMRIGVTGAPFANGLVPHEFGHALGFAHEPSRPDFPDTPDCSENNNPGDTLFTPPDRDSKMGCGNGAGTSVWDASGSIQAYGSRLSGISPLITAWQGGREDHITVASAEGIASARSASYIPAFGEGWVFRIQVPETFPLKLFWHGGRGDNFTTATQAGEDSARAAGYTFVRTEGFVYRSQRPGTVPLKLFWHPGRQDHISTATPRGEQAAIAAGYVFVRNEGFVFAERPFNLLWQYFHPGRGDFLTTAQSSPLAVAAEAAGYQFFGFDGVVLKHQVPGTAALKTFWHGGREDHFATATAAGEQSALAAGYTHVATEGFVFTSSMTGLSPLRSFWHGGRADNLTTVLRTSESGYTSVRTEGFVFKMNVF